jgi:chemotaxis protein MotB
MPEVSQTEAPPVPEKPAPEKPAAGKSAPQILVVKRRVKDAHGHHGGAWKVAYADFVTAMMALFIVLWLMSTDKEIKDAISAFFNNPSGAGKMTGTADAGAGNSIDMAKDDMTQLRDKIQEALKTMPHFRDIKDHVEMTITGDGLRIELLETEKGMFFESGRAVPTDSGSELLKHLAQELGQLPNRILIEGHTDAKAFAGDPAYGNWELSSDRANSCRRLMQANGLRPEQVAQVRGFADQQLRHPDNPGSPSNRRVSVIVQYLGARPAALAQSSSAPDSTTTPPPTAASAPPASSKHK